MVQELKKSNPQIEFEIVTIKTTGDTDSRPLFTINQKGIFEKEIDKAVVEGRVDFAVHSLKDVPSQLPEGLVLASTPKREAINDILITKEGLSLEMLPSGSVIGTSSLRRAVQLRRKRSDLVVKPIRGNIETRIRKIDEGLYDGVILAAAGVSRLGLDIQYHVLPLNDFFPSPGQGALAIVAASDDEETITMLKGIEDQTTRLEIDAERALSTFVDSGCRFPVGAYARVVNSHMTLKVAAFSVDGTKFLSVDRTGPISDPVGLGRNAGEDLQRQGVEELALNWRQKVEEWNRL